MLVFTELLTTNFYFVSTTWFCQTLQNDIYPAELALAKFSLQSGVFDTLHMYINPGKLPLGESSTAKDHANETHKLPIPPNSKGYKDFVEILRQIINFLSDEESIPILYCHTDEIMDTKKVIDKIATQGGELSLEIRVFPLEDLLYPLKDLTAKIANESSREKDMPFLNVVVTRDIIERDRYKYTSGIGCTVSILLFFKLKSN